MTKFHATGWGGPPNKKEKDGQTQAWPVTVTLLHSQDGATQLTSYVIERGKGFVYVNTPIFS